MKVLIAPDSFKGTLSAAQVCDIVGKAFEDTIENCEIKKLPVADGGEGLCDALSSCMDCREVTGTFTGVFGEKMSASYLLSEDGTAVIELASCAGLPLAGENKNPLRATTLGVGEMILSAVENGAKKIILGLGGSATNDCGAGIAMALGWKFLDANGNELFVTGGNMNQVAKIIPASPVNAEISAACDVKNPLFGENGAAFVYAPQKGADDEMVKFLDNGLRSISSVILRDTGADVSLLPGAGAAGGAGAGVVAFLGGELKSGIDTVLSFAGFEEKAGWADVVVTGEGRLDFQSVEGKVISGVALGASAKGCRVITICGCRGKGADKILSCGVENMFFSSEEEKPMSEVIKSCREDLYAAAVRAARSLI